jgi:tight adherence protein C
MNTVIILLIEFFAFCLVALLSQAALRGAETYFNVHRRLQDQSSVETTSKSTLMKSEAVSNPFLQWVQSVTSINDSEDRNRLRHLLSQAGYDHPSAPAVYVVIRFSLAIGLPVAMLFSQTLVAKPLTGIHLSGAALLLCAVGLIGPRSFVDNRISARKTQIEQEFPDALDLLVVCVEAGLGVESAFVRVGQEVQESHPRIAEEFGRLAQELSAGRGRTDALRAMADRTNVDAIKSFVALLIQTDSLGVSIGQTLRTYSVEMREHRFLKAEEKALRIPVLMTIPLILCMLPVIMTTALLPAMIDLIRNVIPALRGTAH